jgi:hypothetical protein
LSAYVAWLTLATYSSRTTEVRQATDKEHTMAPVTWNRFGRTGRPMGTDLRAAGPTVRSMEIASDAEFTQLVGGVR